MFPIVRECSSHERCEDGYRCVPDADTWGVGMYDLNGTHIKTSEQRCADLCHHTLDCQVYEYSNTWGQCKLVAIDQQKDGRFKHWKYCVKG